MSVEKKYRPERRAALRIVTDRVKTSDMVILTDYAGLSSQNMDELRKRADATKTTVSVVKNTLLNLALEEAGINAAEQSMLSGPTLAFINEEFVPQLIKDIENFIKDYEKLAIKGGIIESQIVTAEGIRQIAKVPSKEVLISMLLSCMNSPVRSFVGILYNLTASFVYVLNAIAESRKEQG